ncbi:MAG TPA: M28 family peptidase [Solirubrobacteraceae bacterium]|nr:M28 family peptidase [Solirubrobacteraceae bacterium]
MLNGRLYRAAFLPFVIALAVAAFSLTARPAPMHSSLAPDAFEGQRAFADLNSLAGRFPHRRPGSSGDQALAAQIAEALRGLGGTAGGGFTVRTHRFDGQTIDGEKELTSVVAQRPGSTAQKPIVIVAHRDAAGTGARAELSGTAALLELARVFAARETQRTIVLVSTSGGSGGDAGAVDFAHSHPGPYDAAIAIGDLAGSTRRKPFVVPYSNASGSAPIQLQRTVDDAITREAGVDPGAPSGFGQLAHLAFPLTVGEQGPLNAAGTPSVLVQVSGESGPASDDRVSEESLQRFGRSVLSAVDALDAGPDLPQAMQTGLLVQRKTIPAWALRLVIGTLLLPPLILAADGLARARRRRLAVARWSSWTLLCAAPFAVAALFAVLLGALGIVSAAPSSPIPPGALSFDASAAASVFAVLLALALAWLLWPIAARRVGVPVRPESDAAGVGMLLVLVALGVLVWIVDPFAALLLLPAMHAWLLLVSPELRPRPVVGLGLVLVGLIPLVLLLSFYADHLGLGPGRVAWMGVLLVAGGHVGLPAALLWSIGLGCAAAAVMLALTIGPPHPAGGEGEYQEITIRGPLSYAGPGSLGGTRSALRR